MRVPSFLLLIAIFFTNLAYGRDICLSLYQDNAEEKISLESAEQLMELAEELTICANSLHVDIVNGISSKEVNHKQARMFFSREMSMRQLASKYLAQAAVLVSQDL